MSWQSKSSCQCKSGKGKDVATFAAFSWHLGPLGQFITCIPHLVSPSSPFSRCAATSTATLTSGDHSAPCSFQPNESTIPTSAPDVRKVSEALAPYYACSIGELGLGFDGDLGGFGFLGLNSSVCCSFVSGWRSMRSIQTCEHGSCRLRPLASHVLASTGNILHGLGACLTVECLHVFQDWTWQCV
jgi:hypothetical protein